MKFHANVFSTTGLQRLAPGIIVTILMRILSARVLAIFLFG